MQFHNNSLTLSKIPVFGFLAVFQKNTSIFYLRFETYSSSCTYVCNFITIAPLYQKYRFFGFLPVFQKNTGKFYLRFVTYSSSCTYVCNFITIAPLHQKYRFFGFYRFFTKIPENPTSDSEPTSKVTYTMKFLSRSDHFSILAPNLAGPYRYTSFRVIFLYTFSY